MRPAKSSCHSGKHGCHSDYGLIVVIEMICVEGGVIIDRCFGFSRFRLSLIFICVSKEIIERNENNWVIEWPTEIWSLLTTGGGTSTGWIPLKYAQ
jgi:hypothetical protein